jgi:L-methionine (R)-S-oxide reductase
MDKKKKEGRYHRIFIQLSELLRKCDDRQARMATVTAVLHHKMDYFFWTGFYILKDGQLIVNSYQGPVACQVLEPNKGVCWAGINGNETVIVKDVHTFPGHIACDSRSSSEIVIPFRNKEGEIIGVLDVDSREKASFDETDALCLEKIVALVHAE